MPNYLTDTQVANLAVTGGWRGEDAVKAVAVAFAEHRGKRVDSDARGDVALQTQKWGPSVGVWQIRSLNAERGRGTTRDEQANLSPTTNAAHAHTIWQEAAGSFSPWSTFLSGQYLLFVGRARKAVAGKTVNDDGSVSGHSETIPEWQAGLQQAASMASAAGRWAADSRNWLRVALAVAGGGMMVGGLLVVAKPAVSATIDTVGKAVP